MLELLTEGTWALRATSCERLLPTSSTRLEQQPCFGGVLWEQEPPGQRVVQVLLCVFPAPLLWGVGKGPVTARGGCAVQL